MSGLKPQARRSGSPSRKSALLLADELINTELFVAVRESAVGRPSCHREECLLLKQTSSFHITSDLRNARKAAGS